MSAAKATRRPRTASRRSGGPAHGPKRRRARRPRGAATIGTSVVPWSCAVLAVDTAGRSGWSVRVEGKQSSFGEVDTLDREAVEYIVSWALWLADARKLRLVLVLEAPFGGSVPTLLALGEARGAWRAAWRRHALPETDMVWVQPSRWRRAVLGPEWVSSPRAEVRAHEQLVAAAMVGESVRGDEAAAILIGRWAERAPEVGRVLEQRKRGGTR